MTKSEVFKRSKVAKLTILPHTVERATHLLQEFPLTASELKDVIPLGSKVDSVLTGTFLFKIPQVT